MTTSPRPACARLDERGRRLFRAVRSSFASKITGLAGGDQPRQEVDARLLPKGPNSVWLSTGALT
jgi:hypothetical protein